MTTACSYIGEGRLSEEIVDVLISRLLTSILDSPGYFEGSLTVEMQLSW